MLQNIKGIYLPCPQWFSFVLSRYCVYSHKKRVKDRAAISKKNSIFGGIFE